MDSSLCYCVLQLRSQWLTDCYRPCSPDAEAGTRAHAWIRCTQSRINLIISSVITYLFICTHSRAPTHTHMRDVNTLNSTELNSNQFTSFWKFQTLPPELSCIASLFTSNNSTRVGQLSAVAQLALTSLKS